MEKDTIIALSQKEQARQKVAVWFGSKENYYHPFIEVLLNATDEINNNFDNGTISVKLDNDKSTITISDTGRGIPIHGKTNGVNNYELLLLTLFAGTNYNNNDNGKQTTGTNGVGLTVTNYCSKIFEVTSKYKSKIHLIKFKDGGEISKNLTTLKGDNSTGTTIKFALDDSVFNKVTYDVLEIKKIIQKTAGVFSKINFTFEHDGEITNYHYESLQDYFTEININNTSGIISSAEKDYDLQNEKNTMELVFTTSTETVQQSFLNGMYLKEGGAINLGIIAGMKLFINKYCKEKKMLNDKIGNISDDDIKDSLSFVCNFKSTNTEFANQTKFSTNKTLYNTIAKQHIQSILEIHKIEQPRDFENLVKHILEVQKFNAKSMANKSALKKKLSEKIDSFTKIEGLVDCKQHGENSELFICEGKSALGSVIMARNPVNQAGMAIRGKIMNCLRSSYDEIFKSQIVTDIIKILGCGIDTDKKNKDLGEFDEKALRYGKIMITTDADVDGAHITCLLLTMLYKLAPKLIEQGRVYYVNTPLFEIQDRKTKQYYYAYSEAEKIEILSNLENPIINRNKGLGEVNAKVMAMCINSENRNLTQITPDIASEMAKMFEIWMNESVTERKNIIASELNKYSDFE